MKALLFGVFFFLPLSSVGQNSTKGSDLYRQCINWRMETVTVGEMDEANQCLSYIEGFIDGKGPEFKYGCLLGISSKDMIEDYLERMKKNSDYMKMSKRLGLNYSLTKLCLERNQKSVKK